MYACVCVCVLVRACVCLCVCARARLYVGLPPMSVCNLLQQVASHLFKFGVGTIACHLLLHFTLSEPEECSDDVIVWCSVSDHAFYS